MHNNILLYNSIEKPISDKYYNQNWISYFPDEFKNKSTQEIIGIIKDCDNFKLENFQNPAFIQEWKEEYSESLPETCFLLFTHGTWWLPSEVRHNAKKWVLNILSQVNGVDTQVELTKWEVNNLLRNFSDYMTRFEAKRAIKNWRVPEKQVITHALARALGDPNRPHLKNIIIITADGKKKYIQSEDRDTYILQPWERDWSEEFIRTTDFWWIQLIWDPKSFDKKWKKALDNFSTKTNQNLEETENKYWYSFTTDGHDTHDLIYTLDPDKPELRAWWNPYVSLGTLDGESCHPEVLNLFKQRFAYHLGIEEDKIAVNEPYTGWYTTLEHGMWYRQRLEKKWKNPNIRNVIQIEMWRFLYSKPDGRVNHDRAEFIWECKIRAMTDVDRAIKSGEIDLETTE